MGRGCGLSEMDVRKTSHDGLRGFVNPRPTSKWGGRAESRIGSPVPKETGRPKPPRNRPPKRGAQGRTDDKKPPRVAVRPPRVVLAAKPGRVCFSDGAILRVSRCYVKASGFFLARLFGLPLAVSCWASRSNRRFARGDSGMSFSTSGLGILLGEVVLTMVQLHIHTKPHRQFGH